MGEALEYLDRIPSGWFVLQVIPEEEGGTDWVALVVDTDPDTRCRGLPSWYRSGWVRIAGEHESREDAWDALEEATATRH